MHCFLQGSNLGSCGGSSKLYQVRHFYIHFTKFAQITVISTSNSSESSPTVIVGLTRQSHVKLATGGLYREL